MNPGGSGAVERIAEEEYSHIELLGNSNVIYTTGQKV